MTERTVRRISAARGRVMTPDESIAFLLDRSGRRNGTVPIRREFVQRAGGGTPGTSEPGPLHLLMRNEKALDLLLLVYAVTSGGDFSVARRAEMWARAIRVSLATDGSATIPMSRLWQKLDGLNLIRRGYDGRLVKATKLLEDGTGNAYRPPSGSPTGPLTDVYFQLPFDYWRTGLSWELRLPGKAMLLIAMSLRKPEFSLPETQQFADWYGISVPTVRRGLKELTDAGLLTKAGTEEYATDKTITGFAERTLYALCPPYDLNVSRSRRADSAGGTVLELPGAAGGLRAEPA